MNKSAARGECRRLRGGLPETLKSKFDKQIADRLLKEDFFGYQNYFVYLSFGSEVSTAFIIEELKRRGKNVFVPKVTGDNMIAAEYKPPFVKGKFGIIEPVESIPIDKIDVAIVPLIAADYEFNRVGYGKGYYDRFFEKHDCLKIGLCYSVQVVDIIETDKTDVALDMLVTEKFTLKRKEK